MNWQQRGAHLVRPAVGLLLLYLLTQRHLDWPLTVLVLGCMLSLGAGIISEVRAQAARVNPCSTPCTCGCGLTWSKVSPELCGELCRCGCMRPCRIHRGHKGACGS